MRRPLGFMSDLGIAVAAVFGIGLVGFTIAVGPVLFSPGQLSAQSRTASLGGVRSHAQLKRCGACHTAPWSRDTMADRCLACHQEVRRQIESGQGLHGKYLKASAVTCRGCHTDHRGRTASLTVADPTGFPHALTGYSLADHQTTAGRGFVCTDCHPSGFATFDRRVCAQCHTRLDARFMSSHEAQFGSACLGCHDGSGRGKGDFDHGRFSFALTGRHSAVACSGCHRDTRSLVALRSTPSDCYSCHANRDPHRGQFGRQCGSCHSPKGWGDANFNHAIFPIRHGQQERQATCATCHPNGFGSYSCFGCHAHTPANVEGEHEGQSLAQLKECIRCHPGGRQGD